MAAIAQIDTKQPRPVAAMAVVASALVLAALPFFLVGGLAVQIKAELGLSEAGLGAAVTIGFLAGAVTAPFGGRIADRVGPRRAVYIGCAVCPVALVGLAFLAVDWVTLVVFLSVAGVAVALTDPGLAILVGRAVPHRMQGLAFGIKEASIPAATMLAGIAVPTIALTIGWRWAFLAAALPLGLVLGLLPRVDVSARRADIDADAIEGEVTTRSPKLRALLLAAMAAALGTTAASGAGIFLTDSAVAMGVTPGDAGLLLALGSAAGVVTRVGTGILADRTGGPQFKLIAIMLALGAVTMSLAGTGNTALLILGTLGAFTGGWAWTGIYFLSLVKAFPHRPGAVAGIGTAGLGVGNAAGPVLFGFIAGAWSYEVAWLVAGVIAGLAATLMATARRQF